MIIHRLKLQQFRKFRDFEVFFQPGFNIVKGLNEAGKSTILEALISCLFYDSRPKIERYRMWNSEEMPVLEMEFTAYGSKLILKKDFEHSSFSVAYANKAKEETSIKKLRKLMIDFTGFETDKAFLSASCVRQNELSEVSGDKAPFRLENILLGGSNSIDVFSVIKKLDSAVMALKSRSRKSPGLLITLPDEIERLKAPVERINRLIIEKDRIDEKLNLLEKEYGAKPALLDKAERYKKLEEERQGLSQKFIDVHTRLREAKALQEELNRSKKEIAGNVHFRDLDAAEKIKWQINRFRKKPGWYWRLAFILTFGIAYIFYKIRFKNILSQANCASAAEFDKAYLDYKELYKIQNRSQVKLEDYAVNELQKKEDEISKHLSINKVQLDGDEGGIRLSAEDIIKLQNAVNEYLEAKKSFLEQVKEYEIRIKDSMHGWEGIEDMEEKLDSLKEDLVNAKRKFNALSLARDIIENTRRSVLASTTDSFNKEIAGYLKLFTMSRYTNVKMDTAREGIHFLVYSPEKMEWIMPEELSRGTQDQIYLGARIALVKLSTGEKKPPIIMDDPFVTFDADRLNSAMQVCRQISTEYQIILFTCNSSYDRFADNVIELNNESQKTFSV